VGWGEAQDLSQREGPGPAGLFRFPDRVGLRHGPVGALVNTAKLFLTHCRLTCLGGSEKGTCECRGPVDCKLQNHPKYDAYRMKSLTRMAQHLKNAVVVRLFTTMLHSDPNDVG
jgi:hypothetical protein